MFAYKNNAIIQTKRHFIYMLVCLFAGMLQPAYAAQPDKSAAGSDKRPRIGLALSGGGARGSAHIGILKILEQNHIPVDYIAGTSMGSVIGALYASGMSPEDIEHALAEIDWDGVFNDAGPRSDKTFRDKADDRLYLIEQQIGVKDGEMQVPTALIQGQRFELVIRKLTIQASQIKDFDKLPIPFRAIATDITTGEEIIMGSGDLGVAVRASMAVPAAFAAVERDGRLLVDGGLANNLPISVVRDMGADIIIAVDISTPLFKRDELNNALAIVGQLTGLLTRRNTERQIASLTERDVFIVPDMGKITSGDFKEYNQAIADGVNAATKQLDQLKPLAISDEAYAQHMATHNTDYYKPVVIDFVRITDDSIVDDEVLRAHLDVHPGDLLDPDVISEKVGKVYALGNYSHVRYNIIEEDGKTGLEITATEKEWGTSGIEFGLELSTDLNGETIFNIAAAYTKKPMNSLNAEWRTILQIGEDPALATEWYQPLDVRGDYFIHPIAGTRRTTFNNFSGSDIVSKHRVRQNQLTLWAGRNFDNLARLRIGYQRGNGSVDLLTGDPDNPDLYIDDFESGNVLVDFTYDTLNDVPFPTDGTGISLDYLASREGLGADQNFDQASFVVLSANPVGKGSILLGASFNTTFDDDAPIQNLFREGGFLNLSGLQQNQLSGQHSGQLTAAYMYKLSKSRFFSTYVGASLELGNTWNNTNEIDFDNSLVAGSLFVGVDTPLGPAYLAIGAAEGGEQSLYLFVGPPWF